MRVGSHGAYPLYCDGNAGSGQLAALLISMCRSREQMLREHSLRLQKAASSAELPFAVRYTNVCYADKAAVPYARSKNYFA